jgi:hypothetical protein
MNKPPARAPGHDDGWRNPLLPRDVQHGHDDGWVNAGKIPVEDPMDEQAERLAQQHREQMARQYDPDVHAAADSYARLTERVLEDQRRAQLAQINQAAQRRGR